MQLTHCRLVLARSAALAIGCLGFIAAGSADAADRVDFATQIQPIFKHSCIKCHSLDNPRHQAASGLRLDTKDGAMKGGKLGHDIVPGHADQSLMVKLLHGPQRVRNKKVDAMPKAMRGHPFKSLPGDQIQMIEEWINQGAQWD